MKRIDLENHFFDVSAIDTFSKRKTYPVYHTDSGVISWADGVDMPTQKLMPLLLDVAEERLQAMDEAGIDIAVLSSAPGVEEMEPEYSIPVCRKTNDTMYEVAKRYPGRYLGSAILPVKDVGAACLEMERCVKELGFVGWLTHSNYGDTNLSDPQYRPLLHKAAELEIFVYLHPQLPSAKMFHDFGFTFGGPALGFTVDTMTTVLKLIISGALDEVPETKLLLGHLGEAIPFLLERIDNRMSFISNDKLKNRHAPSYYFRNNIMVTTSGNMSSEAFRCTKEVLGIDHILYGSDYPFEKASDMTGFIDSLDITSEERELINSGNAKKLGIA